LLTCHVDGDRATGKQLESLTIVPDGAIAVRNSTIVALGPDSDLAERYSARHVIDATGRLVSPGLVDPHTHLVHAGSRHRGWEYLVTGSNSPDLSDGIRQTIESTRAASAEELSRTARQILDAMLAHGTTTVEAKSGYGLDRETELRLLRITKGLDHPVTVVPTYLGAHVLPSEYLDDREGFIRLVVDFLPEGRQYAEYCDIACDPISFTAEECAEVAEAASRLGYRLRFHADQSGDAGGAALAVRSGASSVDHLDAVSAQGLAELGAGNTVAVLFPGVTHHMLETVPSAAAPALRPDRPAWARKLIDSGATVALSTDYNPGTCPCPSMQTIMQLAARMYRLSYAEIWHMATLNAAAALDRSDTIGSLAVGKRADIVIWNVPEHGMVIHQFGMNLVDSVITAGQVTIAGRTYPR